MRLEGKDWPTGTGGSLPHRWHKRRDHAASTNCPAISLFTRCTVPLPSRPAPATFRIPLPALRCVLMASSTFDETLGRPSFLPYCRTRSRPARTLLRSIDLADSCTSADLWPAHGPYSQWKQVDARSPDFVTNTSMVVRCAVSEKSLFIQGDSSDTKQTPVQVRHSIVHLP